MSEAPRVETKPKWHSPAHAACKKNSSARKRTNESAPRAANLRWRFHGPSRRANGRGSLQLITARRHDVRSHRAHEPCPPGGEGARAGVSPPHVRRGDHRGGDRCVTHPDPSSRGFSHPGDILGQLRVRAGGRGGPRTPRPRAPPSRGSAMCLDDYVCARCALVGARFALAGARPLVILRPGGSVWPDRDAYDRDRTARGPLD